MHAAASASRDLPVSNVPDAVRIFGNAVISLFLWNHMWFYDLSNRELLGADQGGSWVTQSIFPVLAIFVGWCVIRDGIERLRPLLSWPLIACAAWLVLTTAMSTDPLLSARRLTLFIMAAAVSVGMLLIARSPRQLAQSLAIASTVVLVTSYAAVVFVPELSVHSAYDVKADPEHAGLWRGIFPHKNEAGAGMVILVVVGLFVSATFNALAGYMIALAASVFLLGTFSKTSIAVLPAIVIITSMVSVIRNSTFRAALLAGSVAFASLASLGTGFFPSVRDAMSSVIEDVTFTGRVAIWDFSVASIQERLWTGWGIGAFWRTEHTMYSGIADDAGSTTASHAHNAYLDTALIGGIPLLVLTLLAFIIMPIRDVRRIAKGTTIDATTMMFLRLWALGILAALLESVFYNGNNATCCMMMVGVGGLRLRNSFAYVDPHQRNLQRYPSGDRVHGASGFEKASAGLGITVADSPGV